LNDSLPITEAHFTTLFRVFVLYAIQCRIKEEKVLQNTTDKLIEIGRSYGVEMNVEKTKVMMISGQYPQ
jgi:hypothetical protein